jgi:hypothetical protein
MKKLLVLVLLAVAALMFGAVAYAAVQNMDGWFHIDVPEEWIVEKVEDGFFVSIASPDGTEVITFEYANREGMDAYQFAISASDKFGGASPVVEADQDVYEFTISENGVNTAVRAFMFESIGIIMKSQHGFDGLYNILDTLSK